MGHTEWQGRGHPEYPDESDDGIFWMPFRDFHAHCLEVSQCFAGAEQHIGRGTGKFRKGKKVGTANSFRFYVPRGGKMTWFGIHTADNRAAPDETNSSLKVGAIILDSKKKVVYQRKLRNEL